MYASDIIRYEPTVVFDCWHITPLIITMRNCLKHRIDKVFVRNILPSMCQRSPPFPPSSHVGICVVLIYPVSFRWLCEYSLQWRHNGRDGVSNHHSHHCLLNRLFRRRSKKTSKLRVTGPLVTGEFPAQIASNAKNVFIWWRHHVVSANRNYYELAIVYG